MYPKWNPVFILKTAAQTQERSHGRVSLVSFFQIVKKGAEDTTIVPLQPSLSNCINYKFYTVVYAPYIFSAWHETSSFTRMSSELSMPTYFEKCVLLLAAAVASWKKLSPLLPSSFFALISFNLFCRNFIRVYSNTRRMNLLGMECYKY